MDGNHYWIKYGCLRNTVTSIRTKEQKRSRTVSNSSRLFLLSIGFIHPSVELIHEQNVKFWISHQHAYTSFKNYIVVFGQNKLYLEISDISKYSS